MRFARLTAPVTLTLALLVAGCASVARDTMYMVDAQSGSREICPPAPGERTYTVTTTQMHELTELQEEAARTGMSALEQCARNFEIRGTLDDKDPAYVEIQSPASLPRGLVGIHSEVGVTVASGGEYANIVLDRWNRAMARQGVSAVLTSRRARILDDTFVAHVEHLMGAQPRGKSRTVIGLIGEHGFVLDAETFEGSWTNLEPYFYQIIRSFTFPALGRQ